MSRKILMLAWWFLITMNSGSVIGPFNTQTECERVRTEVEKRRSTVGCWEGSR